MNIVSENHQKALGMMSEAREILYRELHYPSCRTQDLVDGVDRLMIAFEYVEHPLEKVNLCPQCGCFCLEKHQDGDFTCLSCDYHWFPR